MEKSSNGLLKTIIFVIIAGITCLLFFGLGNEDKTEMQLWAFVFILFAELVVYFSTLMPGMLTGTKVTGADAISAGLVYGVAALLINTVFFSSIDTLRTLIVINVAAILAYLLLFALVVLMKKKKEG